MAYLPILDFMQTLEMHVIVNIAAKQSHYNAYTIIIGLLLFLVVCGRPITRPGARGLGPGPGLKSYLRAGPGPTFQARAGL